MRARKTIYAGMLIVRQTNSAVSHVPPEALKSDRWQNDPLHLGLTSIKAYAVHGHIKKAFIDGTNWLDMLICTQICCCSMLVLAAAASSDFTLVFHTCGGLIMQCVVYECSLGHGHDVHMASSLCGLLTTSRSLFTTVYSICMLLFICVPRGRFQCSSFDTLHGEHISIMH